MFSFLYLTQRTPVHATSPTSSTELQIRENSAVWATMPGGAKKAAVGVGDGVGVAVLVGVGVKVGVAVGVAVRVGVAVLVGVLVAVGVAEEVGVLVGLRTAVGAARHDPYGFRHSGWGRLIFGGFKVGRKIFGGGANVLNFGSCMGVMFIRNTVRDGFGDRVALGLGVAVIAATATDARSSASRFVERAYSAAETAITSTSPLPNKNGNRHCFSNSFAGGF